MRKPVVKMNKDLELQLNFSKKTITILNDVSLGELIPKIEECIPNLSEWTLVSTPPIPISTEPIHLGSNWWGSMPAVVEPIQNPTYVPNIVGTPNTTLIASGNHTTQDLINAGFEPYKEEIKVDKSPFERLKETSISGNGFHGNVFKDAKNISDLMKMVQQYRIDKNSINKRGLEYECTYDANQDTHIEKFNSIVNVSL